MKTNTPLSFLLLCFVAILLAFPAQDAHADEIKPLIVLILDTSVSMEYELGADTQPTCYPEQRGSSSWCDDGAADSSHTKSRYTVAAEVLTGSFVSSEYYCCQVERSAQEPDVDIPYHFATPEPAARASGGVTQTQDGFMDTYREDVRFALITFDGSPASNRGNAGYWSFPVGDPDAPSGWDAGGKNIHSNRGSHGGYKTIQRGSGALKPVAASDAPAVVTAANDELQQEIRWLFPYGWMSPVAPAIDDARYYILQDENIQNDVCFDLRPKAVILLTDGTPHFDECYDENVTLTELDASPNSYDADGNNTTDDCNSFDFDNQTYKYPAYYYKTSELMAEKLYDQTGFPLYVVGFGLSGAADAKLRAIAYAGKTCDDIADEDCYYQADNASGLRLAFEDILARMTADGTEPRARTYPATTTRTSFRNTTGGYYEVALEFEKSVELSIGETTSTPTTPTSPDDADATESCPGVEVYSDVVRSAGARSGVLACSADTDCTGTQKCYAGECYDQGAECTSTTWCNDNKTSANGWSCINGTCIEHGSECTSTCSASGWAADWTICFMGSCQYGAAADCPVNTPTIVDEDSTAINTSIAWTGHIQRVTYQCSNSGEMAVSSVEDFADTFAAKTPASRKVYTSLSTTPADSSMPTFTDACADIDGCNDTLIELIVGTEANPTFVYDSYHSSPAIAVAPELDLPLPGYQTFRTTNEGRDTMLYVATNGGVLHAFVLADIDDSPAETEGSEKWAYVPRTIHSKIDQLGTGRQLMVDNTPIIKDVRLYNDTSLDVPEKWATVLVGTFRGGGRGIFALDITDPDDPKFLWEKNNTDTGFELLGNTYAQPTIGSINLEKDGQIYETAAVVLPGGLSSGTDVDEGEAVYVIELSTGELIKTFTTIDTGDSHGMVQMTGSATPSSTVPGSLMTRAFMGDAKGRLDRLVFEGTDPNDWYLEAFHNIHEDSFYGWVLEYLTDYGYDIEPVMAAPSIATDPSNNLVIVYGTGNVGSLEIDPLHFNLVASVTEKVSLVDNKPVLTAEQNWYDFWNDFKLTGSPLIFNDVAFLPLLFKNDDECLGRAARLYATHYYQTEEDGSMKKLVNLDNDSAGTLDSYVQFAVGTVIFGLDLTIRPVCVPDGTYGNVYGAMSAAQSSKPQLVLQTGLAPFDSTTSSPNLAAGTLSDVTNIDAVRIDVPGKPQGLTPVSWGALYK